jgi:hypothetical protein
MMRFERLNENKGHENLVLENRQDEWYISSAASDGEVEILVSSRTGSKYLNLSQDELKVLVEFLQKQIK